MEHLHGVKISFPNQIGQLLWFQMVEMLKEKEFLLHSPEVLKPTLTLEALKNSLQSPVCTHTSMKGEPMKRRTKTTDDKRVRIESMVWRIQGSPT
jgi:hypothetical protein